MTVLADRPQKSPAVGRILCLFSEVFKGFSDCRTLISLIFFKRARSRKILPLFSEDSGT